MFYNVENFFDCKRDSSINDEDFTPQGAYHWTWSKFDIKKNNIAKAIIAAGGMDGAMLVGLCEIENRRVLSALVHDSPLKGRKYDIVHFDSPDARGIDTALLYDPSVFRLLTARPINVRFSRDTLETTRDILYVKGLVEDSDTLNVFVCHAPSRRGGEVASRSKRADFAARLRSACDSIMQTNPASKILIMGDFNDFPYDESISVVLGASPEWENVSQSGLYNLMGHLQKAGQGSYKYQGEWNMLDQIMVSASMLNENGISVSGEAGIFSAPFLLEADKRYFGQKPYRTYLGPRYLGGFSDHLPVFVDLISVR